MTAPRKPRLFFDGDLTVVGGPGDEAVDLLADYVKSMAVNGREARIESPTTGWIGCHPTCADLPRTETDRARCGAKATHWPLHPGPVGSGHRLSVR